MSVVRLNRSVLPQADLSPSTGLALVLKLLVHHLEASSAFPHARVAHNRHLQIAKPAALGADGDVQVEKWRNHDNGLHFVSSDPMSSTAVPFIVAKPKSGDDASTGDEKSGLDAAVDDGNHQDFFTRDMVGEVILCFVPKIAFRRSSSSPSWRIRTQPARSCF